MFVILAIIFAFLFLTLGTGMLPVLGKSFGSKVAESMTVSEFFLGKRGLGPVLIFFTTMATWYSSSLFLGAVAEVYTKGLEWVFGFTSSALAGLVFFLLGPKIREIAAKKEYVTQGDYYADRFSSPLLGYLTGIIGIVFMVPYLVVQLTGCGIIFETFTDGSVPYWFGTLIGLSVCLIFIYFGGMRSVAWTDVFLGVVFLASIWGVIFLIADSMGGFSQIFMRAAGQSPELLTLPGPKNVQWTYFFSQIFVIGLGGYMWPHLFLRMYAAESGRTVRKVGAMIIFASLFAQIPVVIGALAAAVDMPGLSSPDAALLLMAQKYAPVYVIGVLGAGGIAASLSTVNSLIHAEGVLLANDVYAKLSRSESNSPRVLKVSQMCITALCVLVYLFAMTKPQFLWTILAQAYSGVCQFFPVTIAALYWKKATKQGVITALTIGVAVGVFFAVGPMPNPFGIVGPLWGMIANVICLILVSLATQNGHDSGKAEEFISLAKNN